MCSLHTKDKGQLLTLLQWTKTAFETFGFWILEQFKPFSQAGYGRFNITTVWLDAAEPERPSEDTVGQFLFSKGEQFLRRWRMPMQSEECQTSQMIKLVTTITVVSTFINRLMFLKLNRNGRRNRVGVGATTHPDICRRICTPGDSFSRNQDLGSKL